MDQQKWGQPGLATLTLISVHMAVIIVATACVLQKCLLKMAYEVWSFRVSLFWLCCGCEEGTKYANGHYYPGKHHVHCVFFSLLWDRRNSRHFYYYCCVKHLPRSGEKEAFGSSPGIVTGLNPLPKDQHG